jgi:regulator of sigma E protease
MPADQAGFKPGDHITAMNGRPVRDWIDVLEGVQESGGREISVTVRRNGERVKMTMTPELVTPQDPTQASGLGDPVYRIGIERRDSTVTEEVGPLQAVYYGAEKFWQVVELTGRSVVALFKRKVSVKTVGGPILIGELAGRQAKAGVVPYISLIALISINLGILNLLPIPALDGGHLFFYIIEMVFRRPVSVPVREKAQQIGVALLILFMALVFYNDITRIVSRWVQPEPAAVEQSENPGSGHGDADR